VKVLAGSITLFGPLGTGGPLSPSSSRSPEPLLLAAGAARLGRESIQ
jgi:hypothetical protein